MQYREMKNGVKVSALGYGCMRFSKNGNRIDLDKAEKEIMSAVELGINYFDTAYVYFGSEDALGQILEKNNCRDKVYIATKLPQYLVRSAKSIDRFFDEQLKRLRTDHIDYYLLHMLSDMAAWEKLARFGIKEWIEQKKASGQIRDIGFSFHGNSDTFIELADAYDWDFCQIQYNYLDENTQAGKRGLEYAASKGLPVIIMEPLRGGRLVEHLPEEAKKLIAGHPSGRSAAEWALRWLWDHKEVTCILSGMNSLEMLEENARIASEAGTGDFTAEDRAFIEEIRDIISRSVKVGCTGCGYCMPCPHGVDIPNTFRCYNNMFTETRRGARLEYQQITSLKKEQSDAGRCVGCGACEAHCPQHIEIRKELKNAMKALQPLPARLLMKLVKAFL